MKRRGFLAGLLGLPAVVVEPVTMQFTSRVVGTSGYGDFFTLAVAVNHSSCSLSLCESDLVSWVDDYEEDNRDW